MAREEQANITPPGKSSAKRKSIRTVRGEAAEVKDSTS
jgi:hypothetical protein